MEAPIFSGEVVRLWSYDEKNLALLKLPLKDLSDDPPRPALAAHRGRPGEGAFPLLLVPGSQLWRDGQGPAALTPAPFVANRVLVTSC